MHPFDKCPVCGGELVEKDVEKLLRGGAHVAVITVRAEVCLRCGERLYAEETVRLFEQIAKNWLIKKWKTSRLWGARFASTQPRRIKWGIP